ncbi:Rv2732c family membrane protein [Amycolatopsis pigmentata]|uniref:Transmembrane protein n=1 Tax=Amycolatopsis pigmentata TaxID=450801 RepID=A0ABW5FVA1_9PSEU
MSDKPGNDEAADLRRLAADVDGVVDKAARTVDLGRRGFVISLLVFVLIVAELLPWVGPYSGWQVLLGQGGVAIPRLFAATSTGFGVLASALALTTRRWWLTWVCAMGGWFASVDGLLAVWSQQSSTAGGVHGDGPGIGLALALGIMIVLAGTWMRTAWSRN